MPQAQITINGTTGSNDNLPINTLVSLNNNNIGGESTYLWSFVDIPGGSLAVLSSTSLQNPTFTPDVEGTYTIQLIVNSLYTNVVTAGILYLKSNLRNPGAGETNQAGSRGWQAALEPIVRKVSNLTADPGIIVAQSAGSYVAGAVVALNSDAVIKSGLPGAETIVIATAANATTALGANIGVITGSVTGGAISSGTLIYVRRNGLITAQTGTSPAVNQPVYVTNAGILSNVAGTNTRVVGTVVAAAGSSFDAWLECTVGSETSGGVGGDVIVDTATGAISTAATMAHQLSSGTASAGIGVALGLQLPDASSAANTAYTAAQLSAILTNATHATAASAITAQTITGGGALAEVARITQGLSLGTTTDTGLGFLTLGVGGGVVGVSGVRVDAGGALTLGGNASTTSASFDASGAVTIGATYGTSIGIARSGCTVSFTLGSDANYDSYYRDTAGHFVRLAAGTAGQFLKTGGNANPPSWSAVQSVGVSGGATTYHGATSLATDAYESIAASGTTVGSATVTEHWIDTTSNTVTLSLPTAAAVGDVHVVSDVKGQFATHSCTVQDQGGLTINNAATQVLSTAWTERRFKKIASSGNAWIMAS